MKKMEMQMENSYLESSPQNLSFGAKWAMPALKPRTQELAPTLQRTVVAKNEIVLSQDQLREATWLFKQYGMQKPGWLRKRFYINQHRRKQLNHVLREAGLDRAWCQQLCCNDNEWSGQLHRLWHTIQRGAPCT